MAEENSKVSAEVSAAEKSSEKNSETGKSASAKSVDLSTIFGIKAGMTRIFDEQGVQIPVTVIRLIPNYIAQVKTVAKDGHDAYQVAYLEKREKLLNSPTKGHLAKAKISAKCCRFSEVKADAISEDNLGCKVSLGKFTPGTVIDVTGTSKGKGFQGVIKRFNFQGGPGAHGSHFHRTPGSIGNRTWPARVFRGKRLPGHMGDERVTVQNLKIVEVNEAKGYLLLSGSVPGAKNSVVRIAQATKA